MDPEIEHQLQRTRRGIRTVEGRLDDLEDKQRDETKELRTEWRDGQQRDESRRDQLESKLGGAIDKVDKKAEAARSVVQTYGGIRGTDQQNLTIALAERDAKIIKLEVELKAIGPAVSKLEERATESETKISKVGNPLANLTTKQIVAFIISAFLTLGGILAGILR